jgi:hypothetical protein
MLRFVLAAAALVAALSLAPSADAQPPAPARNAAQSARIHRGVAGGQITPGERARLRAQQRHIHRVERRAASDGVITARESRHVTRAQNHASRNIYRARHNARAR